MTDLRKRAENILWRQWRKWRKGNDQSATQGALDAMEEFAAERVAEERKRSIMSSADYAELEYWRNVNESTIRWKDKVDGMSHYDRICEIRGRLAAKKEPT